MPPTEDQYFSQNQLPANDQPVDPPNLIQLQAIDQPLEPVSGHQLLSFDQPDQPVSVPQPQSLNQPSDINSSTLESHSDPVSFSTAKAMLERMVGQDKGDIYSLAKEVIKKLRRFVTRVTLTALLLLHGAVPLSCIQFQLIYTLVGAFTNALADALHDLVPADFDNSLFKFMCSMSKARKSAFPFVVHELLPVSTSIQAPANSVSFKPAEDWLPEPDTVISEELPVPNTEHAQNLFDHLTSSNGNNSEETVNNSTTEQRSSTDDNNEEEATASTAEEARISVQRTKECMIIKPSVWAKYDLADPSFLRAFKSEHIEQQRQVQSHSDIPKLRSFARAPVLADPHSCCDNDRCLWVRDNNNRQYVRGNIGDKLELKTVFNDSDYAFIQQLRSSGWNCSVSDASLSGRLSAVWNAGSSAPTPSSQNAEHPTSGKQESLCHPSMSDLPPDLKCVIEYLNNSLISPHALAELVKKERRENRTSATSTQAQSVCLSSETCLLPADTCSVFQCSKNNNDRTSFVAVLVDRFLKGKYWPSKKFILWLQVTLDSDIYSVQLMDTVLQTTGQPTLIESTDRQPPRKQTNSNIMGKMKDGSKFYIYRFILYSDDFGPRSTIFPRGSVGGVYLKPVDLPVAMIRSPRSINAVSLAPTGVNSNVVIKQVIDDVLQGSFNGYEFIDADGEVCKVFLHMVGYIGDYPEASNVLDVMKHSARAPCTLCNFRYKKRSSAKSYC